MTTDYNQLVPEVVAWFRDEADKAYRQIVEEVLPRFLERAAPDERRAMYRGMDFELLKQQSPLLWAQWSKDALALEEQDRRRRQEALRQYENQAYTEAQAFRPQLAPFGQTPASPGSVGAGLEIPLPLGRFGSGG